MGNVFTSFAPIAIKELLLPNGVALVELLGLFALNAGPLGSYALRREANAHMMLPLPAFRSIARPSQDPFPLPLLPQNEGACRLKFLRAFGVGANFLGVDLIITRGPRLRQAMRLAGLLVLATATVGHMQS